MTEPNKTDGLFNSTLPLTMVFPHLLVAVKTKVNGKETGEPKFGATLIVSPDSPDLKTAKTIAAKVARAFWPDVPLNTLKFPFALGDKLVEERKKKGKEDREYFKGNVVINAKSLYAPILSVVENGKFIDLESDMAKQAAKGKFYSGVEVLVQLNFVTFSVTESNRGVTCYLNRVCSLNKGKRLGGGAPSSEIFKGFAGVTSMEDPTAAPGSEVNMDDIPM